MKFILVISLVVLLINAAKPDYVKVNEFMVRQCSVDMTLNKDLICD